MAGDGWGNSENCRVTRYRVINAAGGAFGAPEDLGVMPWADLQRQVTEAGGVRLAYDLMTMYVDGRPYRYEAVDV